MPGPFLIGRVIDLYKLQKLNVEKIVADKNERDKLLAQGFELVEEKPIGDIDSMEYADLKVFAKEKGIEGAGKMKKEDIVAALKSLEEK